MALELTRRGIRPLVIERDGIAFNASAYAWGGLSAHFGSGVPGPMTEHYRAAISQHVALYEDLAPTGSEDWQLQRVTSLSLAAADQTADQLSADVEWMQSESFDAEMIGPDEIDALEPTVRPGMIAASMVNAGWELDSLTYTRAVAEEAKRQGAQFRDGQVVSIAAVGGVVQRAALADGSEVTSPLVIVATGPWVCNIEGVPNLPIKPIKGEILRLERDGIDLQNRVGFNGFNVGRKPDGSVWAGTYEWDRGFNRDVTDEGRQHIWNGITDYLPTLRNSRIVKATACLRPVSTDGFPIVGPSSVADGLYYANGAGKKGILLSPLMAQWLATAIFDGEDVPSIVSSNRFESV